MLKPICHTPLDSRSVNEGMCPAVRLRQVLALSIGLLMSVGSAAAQYNLTTPVGTVNEPIGSKSSVQTATVTVTSGGYLAGIQVLTEGINNLDFQLTSYSCSPRDILLAGQVCTIGYTFQPTLAGLRRGGISLNDVNGNPLGVAYIEGFGTGPQLVTYAATGGVVKPQLVLPGPIYYQFAVDGAGNIYYAGANSSSRAEIFKATLNADGSYTSALIGGPLNNVMIELGIALDGLGNVYFQDEMIDSGGVTCMIGKLTPNSSGGYALSDPISETENVSCASGFAVDGAGDIFYNDNRQATIGIETFNNGSYTQKNIASTNNTSTSDIVLDPERNVYVAKCANNNLGEFVPRNTDDTYGTPLAIPDPYTRPPEDVCGNYADSSGTFWLGGQFNANDSSIVRYVSKNGSYTSVQGIQFSATVPGLILGSIRLDSKGDIFFNGDGGQGTQGIYKMSVSPSITYPSTKAGTASAAQEVLLTNLGTSTLAGELGTFSFPSYVTQVSSNGDNGYSDCTSSLSLTPGASCLLSTEFTPPVDTQGLDSGNITISTNSLNPSSSATTNNIPVMGTAIYPPPTVTSISPTFGDPGIPVTITGTNLLQASAVHFNAVGAPGLTAISQTQIAATAPSGTAGSTATITVTNPGGTGSSSSPPWQYNPLPNGNSSSFTLSPSTVTQGSSSNASAYVVSSSSNQPLANYVVSIANSNTNVATVTGTGITGSQGTSSFPVQALFPGTATLTASVDGVTIGSPQVFTVSPPSVAVGSSVTGLQASVKITRTGVLSSILLLNKGKNSADYVLSAYSCNLGVIVAAPTQICTITYSFTPVAPGLRQGAVVLEDSSGNVLGETFLPGIGLGTQGLFSLGNGANIVDTAPNNDQIPSVAVDDSGNVYYTDQTAETVSKVTPGGTTTVLASGINTVTGVAVDGAGNVFYGAYGANEVYELANGAGSPVAIASVTNPDIGMATDGAGNIYVSSPKAVIKIDATTHATTKAGIAAGYVSGVAVDAAGNVYYTDTSNNLIYRTPAGSTTGSAIVSSGLSGPRGITVDPAGNLYVASQGSGTLTRLTAGTYASTLIASGYAVNTVVLDQYGNLFSATGTSGVLEVARTTPSYFIWSNVPELSTTATDTQAFENDGNAPMTISSYTASSPFEIAATSNACAAGTFAIAATCEIAAAFAPKAEGSFSGYATLTESNGTTHKVSLSGVATYADPTVTGISPTSGTAAGGTLVTITGTNFTTDVTAIRFGNTYTSNFTLVSQTQITITAPAGTGVVDVIVANPKYSSTTSSADKFTYISTQTLTFPQPTTPAIAGTQATLTATASSGLAVTYSVTGPATLSGSTISYTGAGTVVITASQAGNSSYAPATSVQRTVTVQNLQTITFPQPTTPAFVGTQSTLTATASSGLAVIYTVSGPATVAGSVVSYTGAGSVVITANQAGNGSYAAATAVQRTVTTVQNAQTITFPQPPTDVANGYATLNATASSGLAVTYTVVSGPATISGSAITYTGAGTVQIAASQAGNASYAAATTVTDTVMVSSSNVWLVDNNGTLSRLSNIAAAIGTLGTAGGTSSLGGVAVDNAGNVWSVNSANSSLISTMSTAATPVTHSSSTLNAPSAVAVDGAGYIWVANSGNGSVTVFNNSGAAQTTSAYSATASGAASKVQGTPSSISIDNTGGAWVTNKTKKSVTHIFGVATPVVTPLSTAVTNSTLGSKP